MSQPEQDSNAPFAFPTRAGFWSGETLRTRLGLGTRPIIEPYDWRKVEYASYLLTIGAEIYVTPTKPDDANSRTKHVLKDHESYVIPSGQLALLTTTETVSVPRDAIAFIAMRSRYKFRGLINVSGFHIDPGYVGKLIFSVYNAGPAPIHVTQGEQWFTIFFADLDRQNSDLVRTDKAGHHGISSEQIGAISSNFLSLGGLDEKIDKVDDTIDQRLKTIERDNALIRWGSAAILGFLLSLAARSCVQTEPPHLPSILQETPSTDADKGNGAHV